MMYFSYLVICIIGIAMFFAMIDGAFHIGCWLYDEISGAIRRNRQR